MKTATAIFILIIALLNDLSSAQLASVINGSWSTYFGGNFFLCADASSGEVNGVYSELGYIKGQISGDYLSGQWFQTGLNTADLDGNCCTANRGTFYFLFTANSFDGSYLFEELGKGTESWSGTRQTSIDPLPSECWSPKESLTKSLQGRWSSDYANNWDQCIDDNGRWTASYEYGSPLTRGYIFGQCFFNGQFCHGDWFEPNKVTGGYMARLLANDEMIGTWWQFNASDIDDKTYIRYHTDVEYHGVDSRTRIGDASLCNRNADLFDPNVPPLSVGAIVGISIGVSGAVIITAIVLLCIFCCNPCKKDDKDGNNSSGGSKHHHRGGLKIFSSSTTRRSGFGSNYSRFGGGYS